MPLSWGLKHKELIIYRIWVLYPFPIVLYFSLTCSQIHTSLEKLIFHLNIWQRKTYLSWEHCICVRASCLSELHSKVKPYSSWHRLWLPANCFSTCALNWHIGWLIGGSGAFVHAGTRSLTHVRADPPAETAALSLRCAWIKNVGNSWGADLCWLVGRVLRISWFIVEQWVSAKVEKGELGIYMQAHAKMHDNRLDLWSRVGINYDNNVNNDARSVDGEAPDMYWYVGFGKVYIALRHILHDNPRDKYNPPVPCPSYL